MAGMALFIAFFAGSLTVLHEQIVAWERWQGTPSPTIEIDRVDRMIDEIIEQSNLSELFVYLPTTERDTALAFGPRDETGKRQYWTLKDDALESATTGVLSDVADTVNHVHFTLGLPHDFGTWLTAFVSLIYGLALVSGIVIHLPSLAKDLFALRWTHNLKRFWQDAHNVIGVLCLPFHLMYAFTGVLLSALALYIVGLNFVALDGEAIPLFQEATTIAQGPDPSGDSEQRLHLSHFVDSATKAHPGFEARFLRLQAIGDAASTLEVRGAFPGELALDGRLFFSATSGDLVNQSIPGNRHLAEASTRTIAALHFGNYGGAVVQALYVMLGLAGCFLFYSGNLLWLETRRKRRQIEQPRHHHVLARLTVGVCLGSVIGIAVVFIAARAAHGNPALPTGMTSYLAGFGLALIYALLTPVWRSAPYLLIVAGALYALAAASRLVDTQTINAPSPVWAVDLTLLALAVGFAFLARATFRRRRSEVSESLWASPAVKQVDTPVG